MRLRLAGYFAAALAALVSAPGTASACHQCRQSPCVLVAAPAYQCVTEMVPQTFTHQRTRTEYRPVTETIMTRVADTTYVERQRVVCRPVFDTTYVQRTVTTCRPVSETQMVNQTINVCRPVSTTRQVNTFAYQPTTTLVSVPVMSPKCGHCGKARIACGCVTVAQTCYTPVPVVQDVVETRMVNEVQTRQVPLTTIRMVQESRVENVPVRNCRILQEVVTDRIPVVNFRCEPKQVTRNVPFPVCETVTETRMVPVRRMVAVVYAAPSTYAAPQVAPAPRAAPTGQAGPSKQG